MTLRCKPGDLAYIVGSDMASNIGRIVEVLHAFTIVAPDWPVDSYWMVRMVGGPGLSVTGKFRVEGVIQDSALRPISGLPLDEEITDEVAA